MATTSETIYTHTCDLCGEVREREDLQKLYGRPDHPRPGKSVDICGGCLGKPIRAVLDLLAPGA